MFEEKHELLEVPCLKPAVHTVERMRNRVRDLRSLKVRLQVEHIIADALDLAMLSL